MEKSYDFEILRAQVLIVKTEINKVTAHIKQPLIDLLRITKKQGIQLFGKITHKVNLVS